MSNAAEAAFAELAGSLGIELPEAGARSFDLLLEPELPVRAAMHPDGRALVIDFHVFDAATVTGPSRTALIETALLLNDAVLAGRPFTLGLDARDFVVLTTSLSLAETDAAALIDALDYLSLQAVKTRALLERIALRGIAFSYALISSDTSEVSDVRL